MLISRPWTVAAKDVTGAAEEMDWVVRLVSEIRSIRSEMNVPAAAKIDLVLKDANSVSSARLATHGELIVKLARLGAISANDAEAPAGSVQSVMDEATLVLPIADVIDIGAERERLAKDIAKTDVEISKIDKKLSNPGFVAKAPEEVVEENRERLAEEQARREKLAAALDRLAAV